MRSRRLSEIAGGMGLAVVLSAASAGPAAQTPAPATEGSPQVTFAKHIAPILQRSCQQCHNPDGGAPMSLMTYEEVAALRARDQAAHRRWARAPGVMPPWFVEKNIGIQRYKGDPSLSEERDRHDREVGRQRRAARQPRRPAAGRRPSRWAKTAGCSASPT